MDAVWPQPHVSGILHELSESCEVVTCEAALRRRGPGRPRADRPHEPEGALLFLGGVALETIPRPLGISLSPVQWGQPQPALRLS